MKIEIQKSNDNPASGLMELYRIGSLRPFCKIQEDDFIEILTDYQLNKFESGSFKFDIKYELIIQNSKTY